MAAEDKKDVLYVVKALVVISLLVISGSIMKFEIMDLIYLSGIGIFFIKYLCQKKKRVS